MPRNVKPSAQVQAFDPLCEVQSDKATVEITSPFDGVVEELLVQEGKVAKVGENLCYIQVKDEEGASASAPTTGSTMTTKDGTTDQPRPESVEERNKPSDKEVEKKKKEFGEDASNGDVRSLGTSLHPLDPSSAEKQAVHAGTTIDVLATPSIRQLAKELAVNLNMIAPGSGKNGRIEKKDVEAYAGRPTGSETAAASQYQIGNHKPKGEESVVELGRTRYAMWKSMTKVGIILFVTSFSFD